MFVKSQDYDPNLSWDQLLKSWEENFLGSGQNAESNAMFNYNLESDTSFDNALKNKYDDVNFLSNLFGDFECNGKEFTCVNNSCMELFNAENFSEDKPIKHVNSWNIERKCDGVSKPFLRFVLKKNLTESDINNLLYLLADCSFEIDMGGTKVFKLPKLLFVFLICEKLSNPIKIFDVKNFLELNNMKDIENMILKFTDKSVLINQKYYVSDVNDKYLDIPLLVDFFSYNMPTIMIALQYNNVRYNFRILDTKLNMISKYVDKIVLMFEELVYCSSKLRRSLAQHGPILVT
jgi:hypothetical protein